MSSVRRARMIAAGLLVYGCLAVLAACQPKQEQQPLSEATSPAPDTTLTARQERGQQAYLAYCAMCHGASGDGDGPLAADLKKQSTVVPAHLSDRGRLQELGRAKLLQVIRNGGAHTGRSNLMPAWGNSLDDRVIQDIADYVLKLPDLRPGIPAATVEQYLSAPAGSSAEGRRLFVFYCTACHGPFGKGDGLFADSLWARNQIRPRNLTDSLYFAGKTDQDVFATLALGGGHMGQSTYMPAWSVTLTPAQMKDLLSYIRAISRTASRS